MPTDMKCGLFAGIACVIAAAILFFQRDEPLKNGKSAANVPPVTSITLPVEKPSPAMIPGPLPRPESILAPSFPASRTGNSLTP